MIKNILFKPGSSDPVFWALKEINIYKMELYKIKEEFKGWVLGTKPPRDGGESLNKTINHVQNQINKMEELISIGMDGRAIDNREARST